MKTRKLNYDSITVDGLDFKDYPDFCDAYVDYAEWEDGTPLTDEELEELNDNSPEIAQEMIHENQLYL